MGKFKKIYLDRTAHSLFYLQLQKPNKKTHLTIRDSSSISVVLLSCDVVMLFADTISNMPTALALVVPLKLPVVLIICHEPPDDEDSLRWRTLPGTGTATGDVRFAIGRGDRAPPWFAVAVVDADVDDADVNAVVVAGADAIPDAAAIAAADVKVSLFGDEPQCTLLQWFCGMLLWEKKMQIIRLKVCHAELVLSFCYLMADVYANADVKVHFEKMLG